MKTALLGGMVLFVALTASCKDKNGDGAADASTLSAPVEAAAPTTAAFDVTTCAGCQMPAAAAWSFQGIFRDDKCTVPIAQATLPACATVPALAQVSVTFNDAVGARKANEAAQVTLSEQIPATAPRFRKAGTACVPANEAAVDVTPVGCTPDARVCRDATGALACTGCRTFAGGCPDFEETRMYAAINDTAKPTAGGGNGMGNLLQCCNALAAEAKRMGASPEAGVLATAAAQCTAIVSAAGPNGTAPELSAVRAMLAGRKLPAACAGL